MRLAFLAVSLAILGVIGALAIAQRNRLEGMKFQFSQAEASMLFALSQYGGDCEIHMIYNPKEGNRVTFKFVRDDKDLLAIKGHKGSVFRTVGNVLYFAHFSPSGCGCIVTAHDLTTGNKLWETTLNAVGMVTHSYYRNQVNMSLSGDTIVITGRETSGDYAELLDRLTGAILGHKIFR